ncbi:unnamed protein product [Meganyctiphanes norvegica]|uniref:Dynactin subunit 2 n=1 Tax=Meganyctiphanes norvegica TaxID=48144 RepID=A0AAV2PSV0_MEGNR
MEPPRCNNYSGLLFGPPPDDSTCRIDAKGVYPCYITGRANSTLEVSLLSASLWMQELETKVLDAKHVDFSDRISYSRRRGYDARRVEWEVNGEGEEETLVQKYQRLQCEINQLTQDVQAVKEDIPCGDGTTSATELSKQVDSLNHTLVNLKLEEQLGTQLVQNISQPQVALQKKLINLLESFKKTGLVAEKTSKEKTIPPADSKSGDGSAITYELYYAPEHARLNQLAQAAQLEKKIDRLETLIGNDPEKLSSLSAWTNHKSVLGAIQVLSSRLSLLEPSHLDHIEGRLHSVHTRMNSISEKKQAIDDADKQSKVSELYELVKKSETLCSALPEVVDRLVSLEDLHEQAMQFSRSVKQLDSAQSQLTNALQSNADLVSAVQEKFTANLQTIQTNVESLDNRINKLK